MFYKYLNFHCIGKIFYVKFQRHPLKFHPKYLSHTVKDANFIWVKIYRLLDSRACKHFLNGSQEHDGIYADSSDTIQIQYWYVLFPGTSHVFM